MPVYADVLLVINGFINYLLLLCNMKILKLNTTRTRLLSGAVAGSIFSLKIFLPELQQGVEFLIRLGFSCLIILCAYKFSSVTEFFKALFCFFAVSFIFSGMMIAVTLFINPPELIYDNGIVYYNISFMGVVILSCAGFTFITLAEKLLKKKVNSNLIFDTTVTYNNKSVSGRGLADSGNTLKEPFSGEDVIVANYSHIKHLLPQAIREYTDTGNLTSDNETIRIIPVSTVSGTGLLPAFRADKVTVSSAKTKTEKNGTYIAVSKEKLCNGDFEFILNTSFTEVNENAKIKRTDSENKAKAVGRQLHLLHKRS